MMSATSRSHRRTDDGLALPMIIVFTTVIAATVASIAMYASTSLSYSRITEDRSDRLTAADAGMRYAIDQLKLRNAGCVLDTQPAVLPRVDAEFNDTAAVVECERVSTGFDGIEAFAAVMTGEGLSATDSLLSSQSGSNDKVLGGPVYMDRVDSNAFSLTPNVTIENGPLFYPEPTAATECTPIRHSDLPPQLRFEPELIFGPECILTSWENVFYTPEVPDLTTQSVRDGALDVPTATLAGATGTDADPLGGYTDIGGCRVFEPGRYTSPPDTRGVDSYFQTGDYVMDFDAQWHIRQGLVTAGRENPNTPSTTEITPTAACAAQQAADPAPVDQFGATIYLARGARINVDTQGSIEIHARQQGPNVYVSVQTLCSPNGSWCRAGADGGLGASAATTVTAPASTTGNVIYTESGNNKEFVAHARVYAPLGQMEFGNVSNSATQRLLGGLVVSRLVLQSSTSATNFEISVPTSPITAQIRLTSTATKNGETSIRSIVEYRPYEPDIDDRIRVNSWRVCETSDCVPTAPAPAPPTPTTAPPTPTTAPDPCTGSDAFWTVEGWDGTTSFAGSSDASWTVADPSTNWGSGSPHTSIGSDNFSLRFSRTVDLTGGAGTYRFNIAGDDGQRLYVNGALVHQDWNVHSLTSHTVDVAIADPCQVDLVVEFFEATGLAQLQFSYAKL